MGLDGIVPFVDGCIPDGPWKKAPKFPTQRLLKVFRRDNAASQNMVADVLDYHSNNVSFVAVVFLPFMLCLLPPPTHQEQTIAKLLASRSRALAFDTCRP